MDTIETTSTDLIDTYFRLWNETDPAGRASLAPQVWTDGARHVDPLADVAGLDQLDGMMAGVHDRFPGHQLVRTTDVDAHHDVLRYGWQLVAPDGSVVVSAVDVATVAPDGRLREVAAFFGEPAPLAGAGG